MTFSLSMLAALLAFTTLCIWPAAATLAPACGYLQAKLVGGDVGGTLWNDSYVTNGQNCGSVIPSFMNFTYGQVIQSVVTVYNPTDFNPSHGKWLDNNYMVVNLHAFEVIVSVDVFPCSYSNANYVCGLVLTSNVTGRGWTIGDASGSSVSLNLFGGYVAYWTGTTNTWIQQIGAGVIVPPPSSSSSN